MSSENEIFKLVLFFIYTILYEGFIWYGFFILVTKYNMSLWLIIVAIIMSGSQLSPKHFGLNYITEKEQR